MNNSPRTLSSAWLQAGRIAFVALYVVTVLTALRWCFANVRQVAADSRVVVLRMGALARTQGSGLLWAWPSPIETVVTIPAAERVTERRIETLLRSQRALNADLAALDDDEGQAVTDALAGDGYLLTGDAGIVELDVRVFYKVVDPMAYVLQGEHVWPALDRLVASAAVTVSAGRDLDTILVARPELVRGGQDDAERREQLRLDLLAGINRRLSALANQGQGLGIELTRVDVQSALPRDTRNAFNSVLTATQRAEQWVADARTEAERIVQTATQAADRTIEIANAQASERLAKASADTSTISSLSASIKAGVEPGILMRTYRERIPGILAKAGSVTLVNPKDSARIIIQGSNP